MKKPNYIMQIIMTVIYLALLAGTVTACVILYLNNTFDEFILIFIVALVSIICVPFPAYFVYILIKNSIGRNAAKKNKVVNGTVTAIEPLKNKSLSVFFARLAITCGENVYYTNYLYYTNAVREFKGISVEFSVNKKIAYIKNFNLN